jgi:hypothetical protein
LEAIGKCFEPVCVLSLQREQCADGVTPTLGAAASIGRRGRVAAVIASAWWRAR